MLRENEKKKERTRKEKGRAAIEKIRKSFEKRRNEKMGKNEKGCP